MENRQKKSKGLNIMLWVFQVLIAIFFLMGGVYNLSQPIDVLAAKMSYVNHFPIWAVKLIAISEILGGIGVILPSMIRIKPMLTPLAAFGLTLVMVFATIYHVTHGEAYESPMTIILGAITIVIAWGRYKKLPITERSMLANISNNRM